MARKNIITLRVDNDMLEVLKTEAEKQRVSISHMLYWHLHDAYVMPAKKTRIKEMIAQDYLEKLRSGTLTVQSMLEYSQILGELPKDETPIPQSELLKDVTTDQDIQATLDDLDFGDDA